MRNWRDQKGLRSSSDGVLAPDGRGYVVAPCAPHCADGLRGAKPPRRVGTARGLGPRGWLANRASPGPHPGSGARGQAKSDSGAQPAPTSTKRELRRFVPGQRERREACARARSQLLWLQAGEALAQTLVFYPQTADCRSITPRVGIACHVWRNVGMGHRGGHVGRCRGRPGHELAPEPDW